MAQEAQNRVQTSIRDFVNTVDKSHLRGMEREMHLCAAECCSDKAARLIISKSRFFNYYSPVRMKFNRNYVSFNFWGYTKTIRKCNIPFKSPIKWLPKMQKKLKFSTFVTILGPFLKK